MVVVSREVDYEIGIQGVVLAEVEVGIHEFFVLNQILFKIGTEGRVRIHMHVLKVVGVHESIWTERDSNGGHKWREVFVVRNARKDHLNVEVTNVKDDLAPILKVVKIIERDFIDSGEPILIGNSEGVPKLKLLCVGIEGKIVHDAVVVKVDVEKSISS